MENELKYLTHVIVAYKPFLCQADLEKSNFCRDWSYSKVFTFRAANSKREEFIEMGYNCFVVEYSDVKEVVEGNKNFYVYPSKLD